MRRARRISLNGSDYPASLRRLSDPPATLHVDGEIGALDRAVAIVGTRRATPGALDFTRRLARALAEVDVPIVSGGAEGVDAAAHEGAMDAEHGRTIAVLPTALASPFPAAHAPLFERIATRGARMTEHADGAPSFVGHFVARNRIIAALSRCVVVVQAPMRSGALSTSAAAKRLGLPVLAVPWSPDERAAAGGLDLLAKGAVLCRDAGDVLRAIGESPEPTTTRAPKRATRLDDPDARLLLEALDDVARQRDAVFAAAGLDPARGQAALIRLILGGYAHEDAHGVRRLRLT